MPGFTGLLIRRLHPPASGNRIVYDAEVKGFGVRITAAGSIAFVLRYVSDGRERRFTIGRYPDISPTAARDIAVGLQQRISGGFDPLEARADIRTAPTIADLCADYLERHAVPRKRATSLRNDRAMIDRRILPRLGMFKVASVRRTDIEAFCLSLRDTPYLANRVLALLSAMFGLAVAWNWRPDNPCKGVSRFHEERRDRRLSGEQLRRLAGALESCRSRRSANAVRLILLTGSRPTEVLAATWDQFDLENGTWTKPGDERKHTRQDPVLLSAPAITLLAAMAREAAAGGDGRSPYLFPGNAPDSPLRDIKRAWRGICDAAGLDGFRLDDLRHSFAGHRESTGLPLERVGRRLKRTKVAITRSHAYFCQNSLPKTNDWIAATIDP